MLCQLFKKVFFPFRFSRRFFDCRLGSPFAPSADIPNELRNGVRPRPLAIGGQQAILTGQGIFIDFDQSTRVVRPTFRICVGVFGDEMEDRQIRFDDGLSLA